MRIVFLGSPDFAVPIFARLRQTFPIAGVVTQPDRRAGRGRVMQSPPVAQLARHFGVDLLQPPLINADAAIRRLSAWSPDIIIVAAYGQILSPKVLSIPLLGCLNVHASLLPRWRGASPVQAAIRAGDAETGVTIMEMDKGMDTGPILSQRRTEVCPRETGGELAKRLASLGGELLIETLPAYIAGEITPIPQPENLATYAPLLKKSDGLLDWGTPAQELERQVFAYEPWPTSFFHWQQRRIVVRRAHAIPEQAGRPGRVVVLQEAPAVGTPHGVLCLDFVQPAGKSEMSGAAFLRGAAGFAHARLSHSSSPSRASSGPSHLR
jgi:methionyl-tRNA formyltransferase